MGDGIGGPRRGVQLARRDRLGHQGLQARLHNGTRPRRNRSHLQLVGIDAPDFVAVGGKAGSRDGADIAQAEDRDFHMAAVCGGVNPQMYDAIPERAGRRPSDTPLTPPPKVFASQAVPFGEGDTGPTPIRRLDGAGCPWAREECQEDFRETNRRACQRDRGQLRIDPGASAGST